MDEKALNTVPQKVADSNPVDIIITALVKATPWYVSDGMARKKLANLEKMLRVAYGEDPALIKELAPRIEEICADKLLKPTLLDNLQEVGKRFKGVDRQNAAKMLLQVLSDMRNSQGEKGFTQQNIANIARYMQENYIYDAEGRKLIPAPKMALQRQPR